MVPRRSEFTEAVESVAAEVRKAREQAAKDRHNQPPFMAVSYADHEYRQHLKGLPQAEQQAELGRLTTEELGRLFPPGMKA